MCSNSIIFLFLTATNNGMYQEEITKKKTKTKKPNQPTTHNYFKLKQLKSKTTTTTIGLNTLFKLEQKQEAKLSAG